MKENCYSFQTIGLDQSGDFCCLKSRKKINNDIKKYSKFKFGDVASIEYFSSKLTDIFIRELYNGSVLRALFEQSKREGSYVYLQSPGIRNVASSSYYLMTSVAEKVNAWAACNMLPTMIKKPIVRLSSGIANYAELSEEKRKNRVKSTVSLLPVSDYSDYPINVIFIDDVEITGCTKNRARAEILKGGALSFNSFFIYQTCPTLARLDASVEHMMNQFEVKGVLDHHVISILSHKDYQPVQRMLRLLLHPSNRSEWSNFAENMVPDHSLKRIYFSALSNDYHLMKKAGKHESLYSDSLVILGEVLKKKDLIASSLVYS